MTFPEPLDVVTVIALTEAAPFGLHVHQARISASRPVPPLDEEAFDAALEGFCRLLPPRDQEEYETVTEALLAFWATYTEMTS